MQENNQEKSRIKRNISIYLKKNGISDYEFYKNSGITRGILSQNNGISEENLTKFLAYAPDVNVEWLLGGEGEMMKDEAAEQSIVVGDINHVEGTVSVSQTATKAEPADTAALRARLEAAESLVEALRAQLSEKDQTAAVLRQLVAEKQKLINLLEAR